MLKRLVFLLLAAFWATMNVLLWQAEFGSGAHSGSPVPVELVWNKILTAPDDSTLEIVYRGKKIGYCRWLPNVGEELTTGKVLAEELEGRVRQLGGYTIDVEGNFVAEDLGGRVRFEYRGSFETNYAWRDFQWRASLRPMTWQLSASASTRTLKIHSGDGQSVWERTIHFDDLRNPSRLFEQLGAPMPPALLGALPANATNGTATNATQTALGLNWKARSDSLAMGHSQVRIYRLEAQLFERYKAVVLVSRVGEILRVELPHEILLVNNALYNL
ncbi:MAG: hypothetical protein AB1813_29650 [Verrucomicrobiota bacterium]